MNFLIQSKKFLPHLTAFYNLAEKISLSKIISEASLAISVPAIPIENQTSFLKEGAHH